MIDTSIFANDPPVPADGRCVVCGKPRHPERSRKYGREIAERDPYCSSLCARRHHRTLEP